MAHRNHHVTLYTREGCHLCDVAKQLLAGYTDHFAEPIREVDVDSDPVLREQYDCCVPVVEIDGKVRFRGRVNPVLLRRLFVT